MQIALVLGCLAVSDREKAGIRPLCMVGVHVRRHVCSLLMSTPSARINSRFRGEGVFKAHVGTVRDEIGGDLA
jgi:hypothetical protein